MSEQGLAEKITIILKGHRENGSEKTLVNIAEAIADYYVIRIKEVSAAIVSNHN